ncbi:hypothetical protein TNIN_358071 [Trichonephila inaurata madagascariensis]|uniref:Uncharacterized protein n=1 Tax=Trichonephila inaurata madagascariensis TaxID=2747483 RepID=A0A8X6YYC7_9ARAC|nr:hypothetical protein TNIN_358071 [Trichonephila inaurata madagascariensis]
MSASYEFYFTFSSLSTCPLWNSSLTYDMPPHLSIPSILELVNHIDDPPLRNKIIKNEIMDPAKELGKKSPLPFRSVAKMRRTKARILVGVSAWNVSVIYRAFVEMSVTFGECLLEECKQRKRLS